MSFWKVVAGTATGVLVAYAAVRFPALWDAYRTQQSTKEEVVVDAEREKAEMRQRKARVALVREECGDDDRCSLAYRRAIDAWDECSKQQVNPSQSCAIEYEAAIAKAKAFAGPRTGHEH